MGVYGESIDIRSTMFRRLRDDARILAQAIELRLGTRRGTYFTDPEYGFDLEDLLGEGVTVARLPRIAAAIAGEIQKDERIESATVTARVVSEGGTRIVLNAEITPSAGPSFSLTLSIQDLTIEAILRGA